MKAAKLPNDEGHDNNQFGGPAGLRPMIFIGPPLPNEDIDQDKEYCGGKDWRYSYWDSDICWKFIKVRFSFLIGRKRHSSVVQSRRSRRVKVDGRAKVDELESNWTVTGQSRRSLDSKWTAVRMNQSVEVDGSKDSEWTVCESGRS